MIGKFSLVLFYLFQITQTTFYNVKVLTNIDYLQKVVFVITITYFSYTKNLNENFLTTGFLY